MIIFCATLSGRRLELDIKQNMTVQELKALVRSELNVSDEHSIKLVRCDIIGKLNDTEMLVISNNKLYLQRGTDKHLLTRDRLAFYIVLKTPTVSYVASQSMFNNSQAQGTKEENTNTNFQESSQRNESNEQNDCAIGQKNQVV